jgi:WD40 repeat protein
VSIAFANDGKWLVTKSSSVLQVWDIATGVIVDDPGDKITRLNEEHQLATSVRRVISTVHEDGHVSMSFSPDGQWLATGSWDKTARIWQLEPVPEQLLVGHNDAVNEVIFSPDSQWLATRGEDNTARLWDTTNGQEAARIMYQGPINSLTFSPDSHWLATAGDDNTARILNVITKQQPPPLSHDGTVNHVTFSPDSQSLATASDDNTTRIWKVDTGDELLCLEHKSVFTDYEGIKKPQPINSVAFSPDGQQLATASSDSTARIWDVTTGDEIIRFEHEPIIANTHSWPVKDVAFSANGRWLMTNCSYDYSTPLQARVWEIATGQEVANGAFAVFSPGGRRVALYFYDDIRINLLPSTEEFLTLRGPYPYGRQNIVFSSDGKLLATGRWNPRYNDGEAYVWDAITGGQKMAYMPNNGQVLDIALSSDNQWLATRSGVAKAREKSGAVRIWNAMTGREVIYLSDGWINDMTFSPDGRWLAIGSDNGNVHLLKLHPDDLIADACSRLPRNLTRQEWRQYLGDEPYRPTCPNLPAPEE